MGFDARLRATLGQDLGSLPAFARLEASRRLATTRGKIRAAVAPQASIAPPVLLVGCPRSGTTMLFDQLQHHPDVVSLPDEGHVYWTAYNHPRRHCWRSDELTADDIRRGERRYLHTMLAGLGEGRPLDKTPKNVLRLPYLRALLPEASIVLVVREGRATVASLLEGWRQRRGASYVLPERLRLTDYDSRVWRYVLPPGWRDVQGTNLATVATQQYDACTAAASEHQGLADAVVRYEDLVAEPVRVLDALLVSLKLPASPEVRDRAERMPSITRGSLSPPRPDKWREVADDLAPHLDRISARADEFGYDRG